MDVRRRKLAGALVLVAALLAAACGQKPGAADQIVPGSSARLELPAGTAIDEFGRLVDTETGEVLATAEELARSGFGAGGSEPASGADLGSVDEGSSSGSGAGQQDPLSGDATGVTGDTIKIGLHAPITGAAPVPAPSFEKGTYLYWEHLARTGGSVAGRQVEAVFRNDNFNPSQAVSACREMVEKEEVFLLVGIAGTDQIQACARYAASVGVPYISAGATEIGLDGLRNYFAISMTYAQQGPLLVDMMVDRLGARGERNGMVRFATPLLEDAHDAWTSAMSEREAPVDYDRSVSKTAGQSEAATLATELNQQGIENVYVLTSPTFFLQLANAAANQGYRPQWVGVGLTMALDTVANIGCRNSDSIDDARFLNFFPAFADVDRFDPEFREAGGDDDIQLGLWGIAKVLHRMLEAPGRDLTRERFILENESLTKGATGVLPPVRFTAADHLGGRSMHLNRADCAQNHWVTEKAFASDF